MPTSSALPDRRWTTWFGMLLSALFLILAASQFLPAQSLWGDEATQLSGLSLGPGALLPWLCGEDGFRFGVPPDRTPPLSYWLGGAWASLFGLNESSLRWFSLACAAGAAAVVFAAGKRAFGWVAGYAAGLALALSPNVLVTAVEIRAYALFLLFAALATYCFLRTLEEGPTTRRWQAALVGCCVLAIYTHYFGLVLTASLFSAALVLAWPEMRKLRSWLTSGVVVLVASLGLIPFARAAFALSSSTPAPRNQILELIRLAYRLIAHATLTVYPLALVGVFAAVVTLGALLWFVPSMARRATQALALTLASGFVFVAVASWVFKSFPSTASSYNIWMLPSVYLLLAAPLSIAQPRLRIVARAAAGVLLAGYLCGASQLALHGPTFSHGPYARLAPEIAAQRPEGGVVLYDEGSDMAAQVYFPLHYRFGERLRQYRYEAHDAAGSLVCDFLECETSRDPQSLAAEYVLVVRAQLTRATELVKSLDAPRPEPDGPLVRALLNSPRWRRQAEHHYPGEVTADVDVFVRTE